MLPIRILVLAGLAAAAAWAQTPVNVVFLEPLGNVDTSGAEVTQKNPLYRKVADTARYTAWLHNESAERALRFYRDACEVARPGGGVPEYYVALVPGGNHADVGFRVQNGGDVEEHARQPYILLDPDPLSFETTLLHETGHMAMAMLAGGRRLDGKQVAAIPHTTAALSDRTTAFSEGYAIHLETLEAHIGRDPKIRQLYQRQQVLFGDAPFRSAEFFRHSADLTSYSQNLARYGEIRDNNFAFDSAFQGPDYLRVQLEKARDFAGLRNANQLLQSEGYYASFFFLFALRASGIPDDTVIDQRERQIMRAMRAILGTPGTPAAGHPDESNPWLLKLIAGYMQQFPEEKTAIVDALNDTSHGVFVDPAALALWRDHYLAAVEIDKAKLNLQGIAAARKRWREQVLADPGVLLSRLGPELPCELPSRKVRIAAFGEDMTVRFDLNTVQPGIMRLIPGITEDEVSRWLAERTRIPFATPDDFRARQILAAARGAALHFEDGPRHP
jgi:hypothetical protein